MSLVAARLLTLSRLSDVMLESTIIIAFVEVGDGTLVLLFIVAIHTYRQTHLADGSSPVAISVWRLAVELIEHREKGGAKHLFCLLRVTLLPTLVAIAEQFAGIDEDEALKGSTEGCIVAFNASKGVL